MDSATLYPSQEVSTLPAKNIQHPHRKLVWRTTDAGLNYLKIDTGDNTLMKKAIAIINHNFDNDQNVYLRLVGSMWLYIAGTAGSECQGFWDWMTPGARGNSRVGSSHLTFSGSPEVYWFDNHYGNKLQLESSSQQYAYRDDDANLDLPNDQDFTLIAWVQPVGEQVHAIMSKYGSNNGDNAGYSWWLRADGKQKFMWDDGNQAGTVEGVSNTVLTFGQKYCVAIKFDHLAGAENNGRFTFYVNGQADGYFDLPSGRSGAENDGQFLIGKMTSPSINYFNGQMGVVWLFKSCLNDTAISQIANGPSPIVELTDENKDVDPEMILNHFTESTRRYWRLEFANPGNPDGYIEMGRVFLGDYFEPSRQFARGWEEMLVDPSRVEQSEQGQEWVDLKEKYRTVRVEFPEGAPLSEADRQSYQQMLKAVGCSRDIFIALDYDNQPSKWSFYGKFAQTEFNFREFLAGLYTTGFDFKENR